MTYTSIEGPVADLIRKRSGRIGVVTIDEEMTSNGPGCETCGYGGEPDCDVAIYVGNELVFRVSGIETTFAAVNDWLNSDG